MKISFTFRKQGILSFAVAALLLVISSSSFARVVHVSVTSYKFDPKEITITEGDTVVWQNTDGHHNVDGQKSVYPNNPESFGNQVGMDWSYQFIFNLPGTYDYQCDPHVSFGMVGKVIVNPKPPVLMVNFTGMTPHLGEILRLAVIDKATNTEVARLEKLVDAAAFSLEATGIEIGKSYNVDFFADHNKNGIYDAPPTDHAWRMELNNVTGNSTLDFVHNTTFTNINWKYRLTVHFTGMTPHLDEKLTLFLIWADTGFYLDTLVVPSVPAATFDLNSYQITPGFRYIINFYADHNKNGVYDSPPTDHAWQLFLENVKGDTVVNFVHNTNFTDILPTTSIPEKVNTPEKFSLFPNPATSFFELKIPANKELIRQLSVYSITGALVEQRKVSPQTGSVRFDVSAYRKGIYFLQIDTANRREVLKFIRQ